MSWQDFFVGLALLLVIEGVIPFLNPPGMRRVLITMIKLDDRTLRVSGLFSMVAGIIILYLVR